MPGQYGGGSRGGQRGAPRREPSLEWVTVRVERANERGVKAVGEDNWYNWSQYVPEADRPTPRGGEDVRLGLDNREFLREIQTPDGEPLIHTGRGPETHARPNGNGDASEAPERFRKQPTPPEDAWRMTLLSCLGAAVNLLGQAGPDVLATALGTAALPPDTRRSDLAISMATHWAKRVWGEPVPARPAAPTDAQG